MEEVMEVEDHMEVEVHMEEDMVVVDMGEEWGDMEVGEGEKEEGARGERN